MSEVIYPEWWGKDSISSFVSSAYGNCVATLTNYRNKPIIDAMITVNDVFEEASQTKCNMDDEVLLPFFFGRSHGSYLGAVRLSTSGQVPESYALMRGCIENGLYALYVKSDSTISEGIPERAKMWMERHDNDEQMKKCRGEFTYANVRKNLCEQDKELGRRISALYTFAIDCGAHPNIMGFITTSEISENGVRIDLLTPGDEIVCKVAIQRTVQVGICVLSIYELIFRDRFSDITKKLSELHTYTENI
ncbi:hypothetical protein MUP77_22095 [Candidatus Bathyarchaeota archaeon]|nr:hypothetical protein [Candidatus Bathyarchaeota archaeon]